MIEEVLYQDLAVTYLRDNFTKISNVSSFLKYGDKKKCSNPYISFVIPAYARVTELGVAIESIINQDEIFPYEIIVVDDAPDALYENPRFELIKKINNSHILYYANEKNLGVEGNWNRCFQLANAPYVAMLHDDDILSSDYFRVISKCLLTINNFSKKFALIQAKFKIFRDQSDLPEINNPCRGGLRKIYKSNCLYNGKGPVSPPSCGTLFSKKAVLEIGGFNSIYFPCADYLLGYFFVIKGYDCYVSEDYYGWYRFGINESVKPNVIQDTIKCNYYFLRWLYKQSLANRIWAFFFGKAHISSLVDEYNAARKEYCNFEVPKAMDSFIKEYGRHSVGRFFLKCAKKMNIMKTKNISYYIEKK